MVKDVQKMDILLVLTIILQEQLKASHLELPALHT